MSRKVLFARFHQTIHAPAFGELGSFLPPSNKALENLSMTLTELGLETSFKFQGIHHEIIVPAANVILMTSVPRETEKSVKEVEKKTK